MAKDYFQDIVPPQENRPKQQPEKKVSLPVHSEELPVSDPADAHIEQDIEEAPPAGIRSIRNISSARPRPRIDAPQRPQFEEGMRSAAPAKKNSRLWMWLSAGAAVVVLAILLLFSFKNTKISVVPRSHTIVFDQSSHFTAFPDANAGSSSLAYSVESSDIEDSDVVATQGSSHVETKASGSISIINDFSSTPLRLVKNTRFEAPGGLIYRVPADVVVPGKKGTVPGEISITIVADAPGQQYNIGPTQRLELPGLKSSTDMFTHVFARSSVAMSGGYLGDQPAVAPGVLESTSAAIRERLLKKVRQNIASRNDVVILQDLVRINYQTLPNVAEGANSVRLHIKAHVEMPVMQKAMFTRTLAQSVSADSDTGSISIVPGAGYGARALIATSTTLGSSPLDFSLTGQATLVWDVETDRLKKALVGKDESAFQTVVSGFPGIQEAHARIEPFWKRSFPSDASKIDVVVLETKNVAQ